MVEITRKKPRKIVGKYYPNLNFGEEIQPFIKVVEIQNPPWGGSGTMAVDKEGYHFGWYNPIVPYKRDVEKYGCSKVMIPYKKDECLEIKGYVKQTKANKYFLNEEGNMPRWTRLEKCRVLENKGKKIE